MLQCLTKILTNKFKTSRPNRKFIYAVTGGTYLGELLVYIESKHDTYNFLTLPDMAIRSIPKEKFEFGINENIVEKAGKLPNYVYKVCKAQYLKNNKTNL